MIRRARIRLHYPALVIGLGISVIVSAVLASWVDSSNTKVKEARFDNLTKRVANQIELRFKHYEFGLRGARGAVIAAGGELVTREKFSQYSATRDIETEFPGAHGFGFIRPVKPEARSAFVDLARLDGAPDFKIKQLSPHPGDLYVIQYIEPSATNHQAIGLDIASETSRRDAAIASEASGKATLTAPITLVQASGKRGQGFLLLLPVFRANWPISTVGERKAALIGWTYTVLVIDEVLAGFDMTGNEFGYSLADSKSKDAEPFYSIARWKTPVFGGTSRRVSLDLYGRTWKIDIWALPPFIKGLNQTGRWTTFFELLFTGILLTALLNLFLANQARRREQSIERSRLAAIVDGSNDAIIGKALDGTVTDWNPAAERLFGYSAYEAIGKKATELIVPSDLVSEEHDALARIRDGLPVPHFRTRRKTRHGKLVDMLVNISPIKTDKDSLIGAATTAQDITNLVAYEDQIRNLNASLEKQVAERTAQLLASSALQTAILQQAAYAVIATDSTGTITLFNPAAEKMLGYRADEMVGIKTPAAFHDQQEIEARKAQLRSQPGKMITNSLGLFGADSTQNTPDIGTWTYIAKDGSRIPVRLSISQLRSADGSEIGYLGIAIDLTEQLKHEAELEAAKKSAERAGAAKADFLANMSHEIRTPLNGIIGYSDLALEDQTVAPETRKHINRVFEASNSLRVIIDDILDFSKIEARGVELEPKPFYPGELADNCTSIVKPKANENELDVICRMDDSVPAALIGDASRLRQVLINLLNNAVKFTAKGSVTLTVSCVSREDKEATLRFSVIDTGIGISANDQKKLFQRFNQADSSISRNYGGTGLGLAISKRIVDAMQGQMQVDSSPGKGSTFWFEISLPIADPADISRDGTAASDCARPLRILSVDDVEMNRNLCKAILTRAGHHVTLAEGGKAAIALADQRTFDIILMDVQMPGMDGMEATRQIRALGGDKGKVPIIALTANVMPDQVRLYKSAGMDDHIGKPIVKTALMTALAKWSAERAPSQAAPGATAAETPDVPVHDNDMLDELRMLGEPELIVEFLGNLRTTIAAAPRTWQDDDSLKDEREQLAAAAHKAVNLAGQLGFAQLAQAYRNLEVACLGGEPVKPALDGLHAAIRRAEPEIDTIEKAA